MWNAYKQGGSQVSYQLFLSVWSQAPKNLHSTINWIGNRCPVHPFWGAFILCWLYQNQWNLKNIFLKKIENLSYVPPLDEYKYYYEIDTKTAYHLFQQKIKEKGNAVHIPLIFSDSTNVGKAGRPSFEHSCLLLEYSSIYWEETQQLGEIWVSLEVILRLNVYHLFSILFHGWYNGT